MSEMVLAEVLDAQVVAMFPPRPDAIVTLLHSDDFLPGIQTLIYSLKKTLSVEQTYPPEIVVMVTPNVSTKVQMQLCPAFCTRILPVEEWQPPVQTIDAKLGKKKAWKRSLDDHCPGWTKLRIFGFQQYDTIVYVDADCLVLKDISGLFDLNKIYTESEALIAAAPDVLPTNHFNSGVMVIRPSTFVMETMQRHASLLTTYDGSDTGFLNAYYPTWHTEFPPSSRLPVGYNAQQAMHDLSIDGPEGNSSFWDVQISQNLYIVHYSNPTKPWEEDASRSSNDSLQSLWKTWHNKSKNFLLRYQREQIKKKEQGRQQDEEAKAKAAIVAARESAAPTTSQHNNPKQIHKVIQRRFKKLRSQGKSTHEAMQQARDELQPSDDVEIDAGTQVASMFGMR